MKQPIDPKLQIAMAEVGAVLKNHDVGGVVMLNSPTHGRVEMFLDSPSWSRLEQIKHKGRCTGYTLDVNTKDDAKVKPSIGMLCNLRSSAAKLYEMTDEMTRRIGIHYDFTYKTD